MIRLQQTSEAFLHHHPASARATGSMRLRKTLNSRSSIFLFAAISQPFLKVKRPPGQGILTLIFDLNRFPENLGDCAGRLTLGTNQTERPHVKET